MRIIVATAQALFIKGGAEYHAQNLVSALVRAGHDVELINIPLIDDPIELLENQIVVARLLELERSWAGNTDLFIGLKFPAYYAKHSNKVVWLLHQHRILYDLWETQFSGAHLQPQGERIRNIVHNADNLYLREAKKIHTNSKNVSNRLKTYNSIDSTPLYHPCPDMEKFYCESYDDYILMPSRIGSTKRQELAIEAMMHTKSNIKLYVVGKAANEYDHNYLLQFIKDRKMEDRVIYYDYVSQEEKFKLYANARAVLFIPYDEDYGYITLEAMSASKPIITTTDSGGPLEFVESGKTGLISKPNPSDIARAIDEIAENETFAKKMGAAAKKHITDMNITWDNVVRELTK